MALQGKLQQAVADLARAAKGRAVFIAPDDAAMRAVAATAPFFAPELEVIVFPAWDCLSYDRASPTLRVMAERLAALPPAPELCDAIARVVTPHDRAAIAYLRQSRDYSAVAAHIERLIAGEPVNLIETLAESVASELLAAYPCSRVAITVHKPKAPMASVFGDVSVTVERSR